MEQNIAPSGMLVWEIFEGRKNEIQRSKNVWRNWFLFNVVLLLGAALFIFFQLTGDISFIAASWLEFVLVLPLVYSAIFFHAQHSKAREYLEEYSFKSIITRSIETYREILKEDVDRDNPDEQKKYLDFMIDSIKKLHLPPREIISKHPVKEDEIKVGVVEKLGDVFKKFIPGNF